MFLQSKIRHNAKKLEAVPKVMKNDFCGHLFFICFEKRLGDIPLISCIYKDIFSSVNFKICLKFG